MTKKKGSALTAAGSKVVVAVCGMVLTLVIVLIFHSDDFKLSYQFTNNNNNNNAFHSSPPKIAFLFLTRTNLPLDFLWANFFKVFPAFPFSFLLPCFLVSCICSRGSYVGKNELLRSLSIGFEMKLHVYFIWNLTQERWIQIDTILREHVEDSTLEKWAALLIVNRFWDKTSHLSYIWNLTQKRWIRRGNMLKEHVQDPMLEKWRDLTILRWSLVFIL